MSQNGINSPPPPPALPKLPHPNEKIKTARKPIVPFSECLWAANFPDVQKSFYLSKVCLYEKPKYCKYMNVEPILQNGPTCGLTALSMIFNGKPSSEFLLRQAIEQNITKNGEMFNASNLLKIFEVNIEDSDIKRDEIKFEQFLFKGNLDCDQVRQSLEKDQALILVPYDVDATHCPCLKNGRKAHWAVIIGACVDRSNNFYVIARHGKTKNLAVWPLSDVAKSNSNLNDIGDESKDYVVPQGGISGPYGLKEKCIIIKGIKNEIISVV